MNEVVNLEIKSENAFLQGSFFIKQNTIKFSTEKKM